MTDDFQSISKGVFIIPYQAPESDHEASESEAGPSRPLKRPLKRWFDEAYETYTAAHETYETERTDEQLEDIADWLQGRSRSGSTSGGGLQFGFNTRRIPVGVMQDVCCPADASPRLTALLGQVSHHRVILQGREVVDLAAGIRGVAVGLTGDAANLGKGGRSGMDEVQGWYTALPAAKRTPLLVYIQNAQLVPASTLSELIYVLYLRATLPLRVLLSVPSVSIFMDSLSHIEPSAVEVDVLGLGSRRAGGGVVGAILRLTNKAGTASPNDPSLHVGRDLMAEIEEDERIFGGGAAAALKGLKWRLLHHSINSPLATMAANGDQALQDVEAVLDGEEGGMLEQLLEIQPTRAARAVLNPAPRVSILHGLSTSSAYTGRLARHQPPLPEHDGETAQAHSTRAPADETTETAPPSAKRRHVSRRTRITSVDNEEVSEAAPPSLAAVEQAVNTSADERGDLRELEVLFNLWRSAGRNVNLWDWLEGFRGSLMVGNEKPVRKEQDAGNGQGGEDEADEAMEGREQVAEPEANERADLPGDEVEADDEEKAARLHAVFVRFCEEARMLGLVRARGRAKRADEVVKSIELV